ncbi:aldose 1-epimerase family protein [uncultured Microbacterium sp.]|uniref:aldose 1-epimerase family protein n=1 Tax=uncultured Microbacterium sp. TaxID=191216 RepID=UPI0028D28381|nr:aldose 1-epimerase family protein [uncultured Microbacterium sp.]
MGELYGSTVDEARRRTGSFAQVASVEASVRTDGPDAGTRRLRVIAGELEVELLPDRGLDIGQVRHRGVPLAWVSPTGWPRPGAGGFGASFGGGLVTTCGLLSFGPPSVDAEGEHPQHGRYSGLAASVTRSEVSDDAVVVEATVVEATVLGAQLELRRRVRVPFGAGRIELRDEIVNRGSRAVEPMVLYHVNLGWPVVDAGSVLHSPAERVRARDAAAEAGLASWAEFPEPVAEYPEQVFAHELPVDRRVAAEIVSRSGLGIRISFDTAVLPGMFQWRVAQEGAVVLGVEPATAATILGRADARAAGLLRELGPGSAWELGLDIDVIRDGSVT